MRVIGIVIVAVGIALLAFGIYSTDVFREKVNKNVTGRYTDKTMWYIIGGIALIVAGGSVSFYRGRD